MNPVAMQGGVPTLMAGRRPLAAPVFDLFYDQALREPVVRDLAAHGVRAFAVRTMLGCGPGPQTEASIDTALRRLRAVRRAAPEADLILDAYLYPAESWMRANPDEGYYTGDGQILVMGPESLVEGVAQRRDYLAVPGPALADAAAGLPSGEDPAIVYGRRRVSPFSAAYARAAGQTLRETLARIRADPGLSLWGIFLESYNHGEWTLGLYFPDHGRAALRGFRGWLRSRYGSDLGLRQAWGDPAARLDTARPPVQYSRAWLDDLRLFTRPEQDYVEAESEALTAQLLAIARAIKQVDPGLGVGGFYPGCNRPQSDCLTLYRSDAIDFCATPMAYENRGLAQGCNSQSSFCDALGSLGKVWWDELDSRTHAAAPAYAPMHPPTDPAGSVELLWRDAGQMLVRGHHGWWLDFGGARYHKTDLNAAEPPYSWHRDPAVLQFHRDFAALWARLPEFDRRPWNAVTVLTPAAAARTHDIASHRGNQRHIEWALAGVPIVYELLENWIEGRCAPGALTVIRGAAWLDDTAAEALQARLAETPRATVLWLDAPGLLAPGREPDSARASKLTGLRLRLARQPRHAPFARLTAAGARRFDLPADRRIGQYDRPLTGGFPASFRRDPATGIPLPFNQEWRIRIDDPEAEPLACFEDDGSPALALKTSGGVRHLVYTLPVLNAALLRAAAVGAGCPVHADGDAMLAASRGLLLVHACRPGPHAITWPDPAAFTDLRRNRPAPVAGGRLTLTLAAGETALLQAAPTS